MKNLARQMKEPTEDYWTDLKRLGRYLHAKPGVVLEYHPQRFYRLQRRLDDREGNNNSRDYKGGGEQGSGHDDINTKDSKQ